MREQETGALFVVLPICTEDLVLVALVYTYSRMLTVILCLAKIVNNRVKFRLLLFLLPPFLALLPKKPSSFVRAPYDIASLVPPLTTIRLELHEGP